MNCIATGVVGALVLATCVGLSAARSGLVALEAALPTYTRDIAPILFEKCASCHRPGEIGPMSLLSYAEVRPWARAIKRAVVNREMPPWGADPRYGRFKHDRSLSQAQIDAIVAWADAGAPQGAEADMPPRPSFPEGWQYGEPEYIFELPEVEIAAEGQLDLQYYWVPIPFKEDRFLQALEFRPSNPSVVHHARADVVDLPPGAMVVGGRLVFPSDPSVSPDDRRRNRQAAEAFNFARSTLISFIPGSSVEVHPIGTAKRLDGGKYVRFEMHYTPAGRPQKDKTRLGVWFSKAPVRHEVLTVLNARTLVPGTPGGEPTFFVRGRQLAPTRGENGQAGRVEFPNILPFEENYDLAAILPVTEPITVNSLLPHMHLRGKSLTWTVIWPDGREEIILSVPKYDFHWQILYEFATPLKLPAGSKITAVGRYDNSPNNKYNPAPDKEVYWSDQSWDEMFVPYMEYTVDSQEIVPQSTQSPRQ